jgi:hypothetical protein
MPSRADKDSRRRRRQGLLPSPGENRFQRNLATSLNGTSIPSWPPLETRLLEELSELRSLAGK